MRVLVVHASQFGSTATIAEWIGASLREHGLDVTVAAAGDAPAVEGHDAFVIGSAIHGGHWLKPATELVRRHRELLAGHPVWLFSSGPLGDRGVAAPQPDPHEIAGFRREIGPRDHRVFPGAFDRGTADFSGLGVIERTLVKRFLPDGDWRDWEAIDAWAGEIAASLSRGRVPAT